MNKNVKTVLAIVTLGLFCFAQVGFAITKTTTKPGGAQPAPTTTQVPAPAPAPAPMPAKPVLK